VFGQAATFDSWDVPNLAFFAILSPLMMPAISTNGCKLPGLRHP
jgi:hypothetical protein